jgi:hypothetical protein
MWLPAFNVPVSRCVADMILTLLVFTLLIRLGSFASGLTLAQIAHFIERRGVLRAFHTAQAAPRRSLGLHQGGYSVP